MICAVISVSVKLLFKDQFVLQPKPKEYLNKMKKEQYYIQTTHYYSESTND